VSASIQKEEKELRIKTKKELRIKTKEELIIKIKEDKTEESIEKTNTLLK
jgi:hypothetical protein